ncbi:MAG: NAD(P)H-dependent oxidoreductase subunit E [Acidaminobacteraceae bacterium]
MIQSLFIYQKSIDIFLTKFYNCPIASKGDVNVIIQICIGSACHLKGSYDVISTFKNIIEEKKLEDKLELKSSFCLGKCSEAVSIKINDDEIISMSPDKVSGLIGSFIKAGVL